MLVQVIRHFARSNWLSCNSYELFFGSWMFSWKTRIWLRYILLFLFLIIIDNYLINYSPDRHDVMSLAAADKDMKNHMFPFIKHC